MREDILKKLLDLSADIYAAGAEAGAELAIQKLQAKHMLPVDQAGERFYTRDQILTLHFKDTRFKKVSKSTLTNWDKEGLIKNYGSAGAKSYKESELLYAMSIMGLKRCA